MLTQKQQDFFDDAMRGENLFLTGKAGTGKSYIVTHVIEALKKAGRHVIAVAPTGIAATNIDGQTIHSMFRLNPFGVLTFETCNFVNTGSRQVLKRANTIVIDEISMLRPDVLDGMHWTLKKNGLDGLDKRQIIFVGDMKQLPVILDDNMRSVLYQTYDGDEFTNAIVWPQLKVQAVELTEVMRQTNEEFIHHLNAIREGSKSEYFRQFVNKEARGIVLAPHNATVKTYNEIGLKAQEGKLFTFEATIKGEMKASDSNFEQEINVKTGCKIMYLVNSQEHNNLRNGTLGTFVHKKGCHYIRVGMVDYVLGKMEVTKKQYVYDKKADRLKLEELGSITQYPIKLAYALSIHKAQGLTFDEVTLDLTRPCFQKGQMYVALSRVRGPEGLRIIV